MNSNINLKLDVAQVPQKTKKWLPRHKFGRKYLPFCGGIPKKQNFAPRHIAPQMSRWAFVVRCGAGRNVGSDSCTVDAPGDFK